MDPRRSKSPGSVLRTAIGHTACTAALCGAVVQVFWAAPARAQIPDQSRVVSSALVKLVVSRFGADPSCGVGVATTLEGVILTTYTAIRGADEVRLVAPDPAYRAGRVRVAGYSTSQDVAALLAEGLALPGLGLRTDPPPSGDVRVWGYTTEGLATSIATRLRLGSDGLRTTGGLPDCALGGPIIDDDGRVAALVSLGGNARPADALGSLLFEAQGNIAAGRLLSVRDVSSRERHRFGSAVLAGEAGPDHVARVTPLDAWQWTETAAEGPVPLSFAGPMGRYSVAVLYQQEVVNRQTFEIQPGAAIRVTLTMGQVSPPGSKKKKKTPWLLGAVGAAGAGAAAFLLGSGGGGETSGGTPPGTGTITVRIPQWHP